MLKFNGGSVTNPKTNITKEIILKVKGPNNLKDLMIGSSITILGITYLTISAFKNGAETFLNAENKALVDADIMSDIGHVSIKRMK